MHEIPMSIVANVNFLMSGVWIGGAFISYFWLGGEPIQVSLLPIKYFPHVLLGSAMLPIALGLYIRKRYKNYVLKW